MKNKIDVEVMMTNPSCNGVRKVISIQVRDVSSQNKFIEIELPYEDFVVALNHGIGYGSATINKLDVVGKVKESKEFIFDFECNSYGNCKQLAYEKALELCPDGWNVSNYFESKKSFSNGKARTTIFRYVDKE